MEKCRRLMAMEERLGFRSSFNFVPEGYSVSNQLLEEIRRKRFGIGVHGLRHDWKYRSEKVFRERVKRINRYLMEWDAVGFRFSSMITNLEWAKELRIQYDSLAFDTDPYEPQSGGVKTILPFMVGGENQEGC